MITSIYRFLVRNFLRITIGIALLGAPLSQQAATSIAQHGITWTFSSDVPIGQYANGDYYVVAPNGLTIIGISPPSTYTETSSAPVTITTGAPATVNWTAHSLTPGTIVTFKSTGTLPQPLKENTPYYITRSSLSVDSFRISTTHGGEPISITTTGTGTHTASTGRTINGSMINPEAGISVRQGFDTALAGIGNCYSAALNVARPNGADLTPSNPLTLPPRSSLVSTISHPTATQRPQLTDAAILTVVDTAPIAGSFRPPYQGNDKTHRWNKSQLNYRVLRSLRPVIETPDLSIVEAYFERPWIEIETEYGGRFYHPSRNQPDYGRDMANRLGTGMLMLHLDLPTSTKETLYVRLVQYGIDVYGAARIGGHWKNNGGHNHGRKMPLILAGLALNDTNILKYGNAAEHFIFQEDQQTWFVTQADVGRPLYKADGRPRVEYLQEDVGIPEWGERHNSSPERDGRNWDSYYRNTNYQSIMSHVLMARLTTGAATIWNWPPFFAYMNRAKATAAEAEFGRFLNAMWTNYLVVADASRPSVPSGFSRSAP